MSTVIVFCCMPLLLSRDKLQADLRPVRCLNDFLASKDIALRLSHRHRLLFLVVLVHLAEPPVVVSDAPVVLAHDRSEAAVVLSRESDVVRGAVQLRPPDDDFRALRPLFTVVANQCGTFGMRFHSVSHLSQRFYEE